MARLDNENADTIGIDWLHTIRFLRTLAEGRQRVAARGRGYVNVDSQEKIIGQSIPV
jgi:hypothetical protein